MKAIQSRPVKHAAFTFAVLSVAAVAFAQGKVQFGNDSLHYFVLGQTTVLDAAYCCGSISTNANTTNGCPGAIPVSPLPSGAVLAVALYAGTNSTNLTLQYKTTLTNGNWLSLGRMANKNLNLSGIPCGQVAYFQIFVYDGGYANPFAAEVAGAYFGESQVFTAITGCGITFPKLVPGDTSQSTWAPANLVLNGDTASVSMPPRITSVRYHLGTGATLKWENAELGHYYAVLYRSSVNGIWVGASDWIVATNSAMSFVDSTADRDRRFYRVVAY